jgi:uncharacterized protein YkwD
MQINSSLHLFVLTYTILTSLFFPNGVIAQINPTSKNPNSNFNSLFISDLERQVFALINQQRIQSGLKPLIWNELAAETARLHSKNMASYNFFNHAGVDGKRVDERADSVGLHKWRVIGENLAYNRGFNNPIERVIESWMKSSEHRKNLLRKNWHESGVGISVTPNGTYFFTQVFIR